MKLLLKTIKIIFIWSMVFIIGIIWFYFMGTKMVGASGCWIRIQWLHIYELGGWVTSSATFEKIPGAYIWNFKCLGGGYSKFAWAIYHGYSWPLKWSDYETFSVLNGSLFWKDKNHIYCNGDILKDADTESFIAISYRKGRDKNKEYKCWIEM